MPKNNGVRVNKVHAVLDAINPIEYQAMQMNIEISRRTEALDEGVAPICASNRFNPACLIRKVEMAR
jgi:hypothetical protein